MRLVSHDITVSTTDAQKEQGVHSFDISKDGVFQQTVKVTSDFNPMLAQDPTVMSIGTLLTLLNQAVAGGVAVPNTHAAMWRGIAQNTRNSAGALQMSQYLVNIETAEVGSLDLTFNFHPGLSVDPEVKLLTFKRSRELYTRESYVELFQLLQHIQFNFTCEGDQLVIDIYNQNPFFDVAAEKCVDTWVTARTTTDAVITIGGGKMLGYYAYPNFIIPADVTDRAEHIKTVLDKFLPEGCVSRIDDLGIPTIFIEQVGETPAPIDSIQSALYQAAYTLENAFVGPQN